MPDVGYKFDARVAETAKMIEEDCPERYVDINDINYKKEWDILFKNQIISGTYS